MLGTTLLGTGVLLSVAPVALAQDKPAAAASLEQARKNFELQHYREAKAALDDINAAELSEDQRTAYNDLKTKVTAALAAAPAGNQTLDAAKTAIENKKYAQASRLLKGITESPSASAELKAQALQQLTVVDAEQKRLAPKMKALLGEAESNIAANRLDDAANALKTIDETGSDLGWENNGKPAKLQAQIDAKRAALAAGSGTVAAAPTNPPVPSVPPNPGASAATVGAPNTAPAVPATIAAAPATTEPAGLMGEVLDRDKIMADRARTLYNQALERSRGNLEARNYDRALRDVEDAIYTMDAHKQYFSDAEYRNRREAAQALLTQANNLKLAQQEEQTRVAIRNAEIADRNRAEALERQRQQRVRQLFRDAETFDRQEQYKETADTLRQIIVVDPTNIAAKGWLRRVEDKLNYRKWEELNTRQAVENMRQQVLSKDEMIPYSDLLVYPEDWVELTRLRVGEKQAADSPVNRATRDKLEEPMKEISAENQSFEKVINFIRDNAGINIFINWNELQGAGVDRNTQVSINLRDVPIRKALTTILSEVSPTSATEPEKALGYTIDEGVVTISSRKDLNARYQVVRVYDIRDLTLPAQKNIQIPSLGLGQSTTYSTGTGGTGGGGGLGGGGGGGGAGGGGLFPGAGPGGGAGGTSEAEDYKKAVQDVMNTIASTVDPTSWKTVGTEDKGGTIGSIRELNGQLVINQTIDNQIAVYNLLQQLRETRTIQVSIEARILLVASNFLDDFGLGWTLNLPYGSLGSNVSGVTINQQTYAQAVPQNTGIPGSLGGTLGGTAANSALTVGGTILDNWSLSLLIRATQADLRTTSVTAPRVTLFNGDQANIFVGSQTNYVQNFTQNAASGGLTGGGAVGTTPVVAQLNTGVNLNVTATVSADRRYVLMNIMPNLASLDGIDTFTSSGTSTQAASQGAATQPLVFGQGFLQVPKVSVTQVVTRVSIPDGGTLLIGGQKLVGEREIEVGVPLLSKIPFVNRLFTNRNYVKDERTLLILVRPKIIIQREEETKLFGPDYDRPTNLPRLEGGPAARPAGAPVPAGATPAPAGT